MERDKRNFRRGGMCHVIRLINPKGSRITNGFQDKREIKLSIALFRNQNTLEYSFYHYERSYEEKGTFLRTRKHKPTK